DSGTPREVRDSLHDMRMANRFFGGARAAHKLLLRVARQRQLASLNWLDVGGAGGDLAALLEKPLAASGVESRATILDRAPSHMNGAHPSVCGDALALPFRANSFDVVVCTLFAHHLEPQDLVNFTHEALRVARHAFVIDDLVRNPMHLALIYAGYALYRSRLTRHDAVASVRRAYTLEEMTSILGRAGAPVEIDRHFLFRMGAIVWKTQKSSTT
ncbi:MAG TPA: methyltransferase domain-containing protein, partial [Terriglobales bacterium]|nr:methyltransferase domain-containing protein [Terriglobales bacterium]